MKKVVFLVVAILVVTTVVLAGCAGGGGNVGERPLITFAIAGPMTEFPGERHWWGAELARNEINGGAGVNVGGVYHKIELVQVDTNEISGTPEEGVAALQEVMDDVDFVLGGFRINYVEVYREVAMDAKKVFMNCGVPVDFLQYSVIENYDHYKYWFKVTPLSNSFMVHSLLKITVAIGDILKNTLITYGDTVAEDYRVPEDGKLRVAILTESTPGLSNLGTACEVYLPSLGFTVAGTWLVSSTAIDITTDLSQIVAMRPHIILTFFSGPIGITYSKQRVDLGIPAMTIGINLVGELKSHWADTDGKCNGGIMLNNWAEGLEITAKTIAFSDSFVAKTGEYPFYTAGTYNAIYSLKEAIEAVSAANGWDNITDVVDPDNIDALIQYLETSSYTGMDSRITYYPRPAIDLGSGVYALSEAQVRALYPSLETYNQNDWLCAASGGPYIAHDIVYGPGYATGIGSQWQDGKKVGVWPIDFGDDYDEALTDQYGCWNFEYPGTVDVMIPIEGFLAS